MELSSFSISLLHWLWAATQMLALAIFFFWLTCANDGWSIFLGMEAIAVALLLITVLIFNLVGIEINDHQWLIIILVCWPLAVMFLYQSGHTYRNVLRRRAKPRS